MTQARAAASALLIGCLLLLLGFATAGASGDTSVRQPSFSSIPCRGTVTEYRTEEGNVHNGFAALFMICRSSTNHAEWIVRASAGCDDGGVDDAPNTCGVPNAQPVERFVQSQGNTNIYQLARYVFGSDCFSVRTTVKNMAAKTNRVRSSSGEGGWVCRQVDKVDGITAEADGRVMGPSGFQYVRVTTRGGDATNSVEDSAEATGEDIFGTEDRDYHYQVTFNARGVVEK